MLNAVTFTCPTTKQQVTTSNFWFFTEEQNFCGEKCSPSNHIEVKCTCNKESHTFGI